MKNIVIVSLMAAFIFFAFIPSRAQGQFLFLFKNPLIGKQASDFTLPTTNGQKLNMTQYRDGNSAIIFFWATWCPHCRVALTALNRDHKVIEQKGIKLILVDLEESERVVKDYQKKNKIALDIFLDKNSSTAEDYKIMGVPTFVLVDKNGIVQSVEHTLPEDYEEILTK